MLFEFHQPDHNDVTTVLYCTNKTFFETKHNSFDGSTFTLLFCIRCEKIQLSSLQIKGRILTSLLFDCTILYSQNDCITHQ